MSLLTLSLRGYAMHAPINTAKRTSSGYPLESGTFERRAAGGRRCPRCRMLTCMLRAPTQGYDIAKRATMEFLDSFAEAVDTQDREILRCVARRACAS